MLDFPKNETIQKKSMKFLLDTLDCESPEFFCLNLFLTLENEKVLIKKQVILKFLHGMLKKYSKKLQK